MKGFELTTNVPDLSEALAFYERLGFRRLCDRNRPQRAARVSDGFVVVALRPASTPGTCLSFAREAGAAPAACQNAPGSLRIEILPEDSELDSLPGKAVSRCGLLGEISMEVDDVAAAKSFWTTFGFMVPPAETLDWVSMERAGLTFGLYRSGTVPYSFRSPALTYFDPEMPSRLESLRRDGFRFASEFVENGQLRNAIAEAPGGQSLLLFGG